MLPVGLLIVLCANHVFVSRHTIHVSGRAPAFGSEKAPFALIKGDLQLSIGAASLYFSVVSNRAPLHKVEIIFYSTAVVFAAIGLTWYFLH